MRGQLQPGPAPTLAQALKATEAAIEDAGEAADAAVIDMAEGAAE